MAHPKSSFMFVLQDGNSPLTHASVENDIELVKLFCDYHANMNHQGKVRYEAVFLQHLNYF